MKSPVSHRIVKLALVTGLAALFALLTVGSVLATTLRHALESQLPNAKKLVRRGCRNRPDVL